MTFNEYQDATTLTAAYPKDKGIEYNLMSMGSEAGEALGKLSKLIRKGGEINEEFKLALSYELGDTLYHLARVALHIGFPLEKIAEMNIEKLKDRLNRGVICGNGDNR